MIYVLITTWLLMGITGYMLMRQGSLVDYETWIGKQRAWSKPEAVFGMVSVLFGPLFIAMAFGFYKKSCIKRRTR